MVANIEKSETSLVEWALAWLKKQLPEDWEVELSNAFGPGKVEYTDARLLLRAGGYNASIALEARSSLTPREAENLLPRLAQVLQSMVGNPPVLIVAPWLSTQTQELLAERDINFIDRTGNALIRLRNPAVLIKTVGSPRNPRPPKRGKAQLRGPKAGRLLRTLIDVRPPYTVKDLSAATGLAPGYVSRLVDALYEDALIERMPRGPVESVDIFGLLRRWATSYDVFKTNQLSTYIAPAGWGDLVERLALDQASSVVITGSVAAGHKAPVASPTMLLAYGSDPERLAREFDLLPADEGADVGLLLPYDPVVWARTEQTGGLRFAAPSQVALDCLTGNGRMPAEGQALLDWMLEEEEWWRKPRLEDEAWEL